MTGSDDAWAALDRELDLWAASGRVATLWWRDDDTARPSPALDRLLDIAARHDAPVALAVIPAQAVPELAARLAAGPARIAVLQHGYAHLNHAPAGEKKAELGAHRPADAILAELIAGRQRLAGLFADAALPAFPVMVPPWNRIDPGVVDILRSGGFAALSAYGARRARLAAPNLLQVNTHADIVDWRGSRGFLGERQAIALVTRHLAARRSGEADAAEPTGLMTHHLVHDEACWNFCFSFAARVGAHPAARWLDASTIFNMFPNSTLP